MHARDMVEPVAGCSIRPHVPQAGTHHELGPAIARFLDPLYRSLAPGNVTPGRLDTGGI
jgi:hypothetical protein